MLYSWEQLQPGQPGAPPTPTPSLLPLEEPTTRICPLSLSCPLTAQHFAPDLMLLSTTEGQRDTACWGLQTLLPTESSRKLSLSISKQTEGGTEYDPLSPEIISSPLLGSPKAEETETDLE